MPATSPERAQPQAPPPQEPTEAERALCDLAGRRTLPIPAPLLAQHALRVTEGADWPVQRAAMEALLRRLANVQKERLRIAARGKREGALGVYTTRRAGRGGAARPYTTVLWSVDPIDGRCACPDFLKGSLGLCKHLLAVLDPLFRAPRKLAAARAAQGALAPLAGPPRLCLLPIRPLLGPGDWLGQVRLWPGRGAAEVSLVTRRALRLFAPGEGARALRTVHEADPPRRLQLVRELKAAVEATPAPFADPALLGYLDEEAARLARATEDQALRGPALQRALDGLRCPLYPYQLEGVTRLLSTGRLLLADDMGLGKTAQAIAACHVLWHAGRVRRGLLVVPASLKPQWLREWGHFTAIPLRAVDGNPEEREAIYRGAGAGFLVASYDVLLRDLAKVQELAPDLVVLDEAQRMKNWATKTAACIKTLNPAYRLVLSGTPMENRLDELASIMDFVDPLALEPKWRLQPLHGLPDGTGARHLSTLRQRLAPSMLRRVRKEVLAQLPARTDTRVPVEMTPQQREAHDELLLPIARLVSILQRRPLSPEEHLRLMLLLNAQRIIANGLGQLNFQEVWPTLRTASPEPAILEGLFMPKLEALRELVRQLVLAQGRKVVIFSQWRRMLTLSHFAVRDLLGAAGLRAVFFTGAQAARQRTQNIVEFHDDPQTRVMFLTDAGGVGLNLQRAASACINLELPWNPAVLEQRVGRIYRLGQRQPIDVYNLVTEAGIEARIADLLGSKQALFSGLFDGDSNEVRYEGGSGFLARVEALVPAALLRADRGDAEENDEAIIDREVSAVLREADEAEDLVVPEEAGAGGAGEAVHEAPPALPPRGAAVGGTTAHAEGATGGTGPRGDAPEIQGDTTATAEDAGGSAATAGGSAATAQAPGDAAGALNGEAVRRFFSEVRIQRTPEGGMTLTATPGAAETLAALFSGMAQLLGG